MEGHETSCRASDDACDSRACCLDNGPAILFRAGVNEGFWNPAGLIDTPVFSCVLCVSS
jgi:hypothetical protein